MKVLQLTVHLFPNIGGVETHLNDLFNALTSRNYNIFCLAYQPLSTRVDWKIIERGNNLIILRIPWFKGFFEKLVKFPLLEFIYLVPGLFLVTPFVIIFYRPKIIHAHGISAATSAVFWGKIFKIKTVISLHSFYSFPKKGLYRNFVKILFDNCDYILCLSKKSKEEVTALGVDSIKCNVFTYWIDLRKFKKITNAKKILKWKNGFTSLFVGRLIEEKGIRSLIDTALIWKSNINLVIAGSGPMEEYIVKKIKGKKNISFFGKVSQEDLPLFYSGANCLIVPSISEEGFGRVIIESLACETPVIASSMGAIREAMSETVGQFVDGSMDNLRRTIENFAENPGQLKKFSQSARAFVERRYSEKNVETIIKSYTV